MIINWRKSTRSANNATCVEIAGTLGAVRDSKNPSGPTLPASVSALIAAIKAGDLT